MNAQPSSSTPADVAASWNWARGHEKDALRFVLRHVAERMTAIALDSPDEVDRNQATDYEIKIPGEVRLAVRVRRQSSSGKRRDFTLRATRPSGRRTEVDKIGRRDGPDLYLFVWIEDRVANWPSIDEVLLVDVRRFVKAGLLDNPEGTKSNRDGSSTFHFWRWETLQDAGCVIYGVKHPGSPVQFRMRVDET